jgi:glycosyltransferase involved in cell wall biosynthesis
VSDVLLTIVVPAYNAAPHLARCLDSVTGMGDAVEVVVVDDGSTDDTAAIATAFAKNEAGRVRLVRQANRGHGGAVNTGLREARGQFVRVVDADDWLDRDGYRQLLATLAGPARGSDLVVTNFVYDKAGRTVKSAVRYASALPPRQMVAWSGTGRFGLKDYLLMHSLTYRTEIVRSSGIILPEHCFYVDSLYAFVPLSQVQTLFYLDSDLYHYSIGRPDQSVAEDVMLTRLDQQFHVNRLMVDHLAADPGTESRLRRYRVHYLAIITAVSSLMSVLADTPDALQAKADLWSHIRHTSVDLHAELRRTPYGVASNLPGRLGRRVSIAIYHAAQKAVGFN